MTNFIVFDLETSISKGVHGPDSKDPTNDFYTVIIGNSANSVHVIHKKEGFGRKLPDVASKLLEKADVILGHNLPFDLSYIYKTKEFQNFMLRGGQIWDTQIAEYILSGQRFSNSALAELQYKYLGEKIKENRISRLFAKKIGADRILAAEHSHPRIFALYNKYCKGDGETPFKIFQKQYTLAKQLGCLDAIKLSNNYALSLVILQNTGIPVDIKKCEMTHRDFKIKAVSFLQEAIELVLPLWDSRLKPFNVNSPKDKSAILFGGVYKYKVRYHNGKYKNGNPKWSVIEKELKIDGFKVPTSLSGESKIKGRYQTGDDVIEKISHLTKNPQLKKYCELQKQAMLYGKMCSTYLKAFLDRSVDGVLYPNYNNTLTITSRLSSSKPNLQNVPSKGDMLVPIQGQLIAPEGWTAVSADYSQLEIYISAYLSNDPALINDLLSGVDFHIKRLSYAEDMLYDEVYKLCKIDKLPEWDAKRTNAKTVSYQKAYGAAPKSLAKATGLSEEIINKIFTKEDEEYSKVAEFNASVMESIKANQELSYAKNLPAKKKGSGKDAKRFINGIELLPITQYDGKIIYDSSEYRHVGIYKCITGKRYSFEEMGRMTRHGLKRGYSTTQTKNYHIQGTASDVQATSSVALTPLLLKHPNKIKMVNEIHDSKWFLVRTIYLHKICVIIKQIMENVPENFKKYLKVDMPFKIPVDFKIGKNFAEMESYNVL